ncbi:uncharacterized protein MJAP1_001599 [Malassezia japonica]|uniref:RFX-type winged-helix domain-containing protein n=1 Tax=Malassezia japonica TaxID=223818 RepID=A0AAF0J9N8_9BASI|nr:uncharacterized protein MJAP1_001599 [Malassezia japonica]WFD38638.1 hypothetical protein MJAP1_001599 [Malassezia japonica]
MNGNGISVASAAGAPMRRIETPLGRGTVPMARAAIRSEPMEPLYLEPGPTNRLYLSLCSGIPSQMDWALARLCSYTQQLGDRFQLSDYPGLDEALVRWVKRLGLALSGAPRHEWDEDADQYATASNWQIDCGIGAPGDNGGMGLAASSVALSRPWKPTQNQPNFAPQRVAKDAALLQRALAATLVLRNTVLSAQNAALLTVVPGVLQVVFDVARHTLDAHPALALDACADLRVNILDVLESLAPRIVLSDFVRTAYASNDQNEAPTRTEDKVFVLLHTLLHTTRDRALLLASLRCLRAIASNEANAPQWIDATPNLAPTRLGITARCLALLPLTQDPELLEAAVDLLYQTVATGENALLLGALTLKDVCDVGYGSGLARRALQESDEVEAESVPLLHAVLTYLVRNLALGKTVWERDTPLAANTTAPWAAAVPSAARARRQRERERRQRKEHASPQERARWKELTSDELERLRRLDEPERGIEWMKLLFECDAQGEVTQMEFWIAYRDQFTPIAAEGGAPLQPAANLIRNVSQTFPGAAAMVISPTAGGQPRFIIRGISLRERSTPPIACHWQGCPAPQVGTWDIVREHLAVHAEAARDGQCWWKDCAYRVPADDARRAALLYRHALTHTPQPVVMSPTPTGPPAQGTVENPGVITFVVERTPSVPNATPGEAPLPCGVAFLSALVLRFVSRTAHTVLESAGRGCPPETYGGAVSATPMPSEGDERFGCPVPRSVQDAVQDAVQQGPTLTARHIHAAAGIMDALAGAEETMVQTALRNDILCRLINDILVAIRPVSDS